MVLGLLGYFYGVIVPRVPAIDAVTDYRPKIPLRIYTADNVLIGEFGEEHRDFIPIEQVPELMKNAVLAIEDTRFYQHGGVDWIRAAGAARANLRGGFREGASTITMQVARNFFLTRDKVLGRKADEVALAFKIESALKKDKILELYMNQIFLGRRSYGFASAAQAYFGKRLDQLSIAEMAMLAGVPRDPVGNNPAVNPRNAKQRQMVVLKRMRELGYLSDAQYAGAKEEPIRIAAKRQEFDTHAEYVAELARQAVVDQYKDDAYTRGISVYTTILKAEQDAAYDSLRRNVLAYDQRHGYRGPESFINLPANPEERSDEIREELRKRPVSDGLMPTVVTEVSARLVAVETMDGERIEISGTGLRFAAPALAAGAKEAVKLRPGAVVRIAQDKDKDKDKDKGKDKDKDKDKDDKEWAIVQLPQVAAGFVAIDSATGAYHALVGGFDYGLNKYNHVTQAWRQPGSSIKPFIYSASIEKGYSPGTRILDEALEMPSGGGNTWTPQNDDGKFDGEVTMRRALVHSKNVPSVRLLRAIEVGYAHEFLGKFGFDLTRHPKNLTMALGTGAVTPLQMAGAYAVFANGGFAVKPYLIARIKDGNGTILLETPVPAGGDETTRVLDPRNAFLVDSMLRDVTRFGTAAGAAKQLGRGDLAGKTGTTSDAFDGWFAGYAGNVVGVAWMGYDDPRSLGGREFGATLAMPIWVDYMRAALDKHPVKERAVPEGVMREDDDWIYAEYAGSSEFKTIDMDALPALPADPAEPGEPGEPAVPGQPPVPGLPAAPPVPQAPQPVHGAESQAGG
ncbi:PBP1A family penicillin-binding protein [Massilia sp. P8910]|uniref:penicillin-binding protein 1A n=1 Tax=Massilia antarctica TaxID=2765360 RepID=UPI001E354E52|nr:PBP1A family penicillin-binding protein [Massilia antarctica]MCE3606366.1 PBP1A family penicillin-binding protein [Massilia antarctica]